MEKFRISYAEKKDLPRILQIYDYAREFMKATGNASQWKDNFPPETLLIQDILEKQLYVVKSGEEIHGCFAFILGKEPAYAQLEGGEWRLDTEYGTIHRVAGDGRTHGLFDAMVAFCWEKIKHVRLDTHVDNHIMQRLISRQGFKRCGIIYVADGSPRIAYEKI